MTDKKKPPTLYKVNLAYQSGDILPGEIEVTAEFVIHVAMMNNVIGRLNAAYAAGEIKPLLYQREIRWPQ